MARNGRSTVIQVQQDIELVAEQVAQLTQHIANLEERIQVSERRMTVQMQSTEGDLRELVSHYRLEFVELRQALDGLAKWTSPPVA